MPFVTAAGQCAASVREIIRLVIEGHSAATADGTSVVIIHRDQSNPTLSRTIPTDAGN